MSSYNAQAAIWARESIRCPNCSGSAEQVIGFHDDGTAYRAGWYCAPCKHWMPCAQDMKRYHVYKNGAKIAECSKEEMLRLVATFSASDKVMVYAAIVEREGDV